MQANGAEMPRLAAIFGREKDITICATIHDAILIEAPLDELEKQTAIMQAVWQNLDALCLTVLSFVQRWDIRGIPRLLEIEKTPCGSL